MKLKHALLGIVMFASGCCLSAYSPKSQANVLALKAEHINFINGFTDNGTNVYDLEKLNASTALIETQFSVAIQYTGTMCDKHRTKNIELLRDVFAEDERNIRQKQRLLTEPEGEMLKDATIMAYDTALKAECAHNGSEGFCK